MSSFSELRNKIEQWATQPKTRDSFQTRILLGCDSLPMTVFRSAASENIQGRDLVNVLEQFIQIVNEIVNAPLLKNQAKGISYACIAACGHLDIKERQEALDEAIKCIHVALPDLHAGTVVDKLEVPDEWERLSLERIRDNSPVMLGTAVVVVDLIRHLRNREPLPDEDHTVQTPVLFRLGETEGAEGFVGNLRVELIRDGIVGITPDLAVLGANVIHTAASQSAADSLHESVMRIWKMAGLENCRARWSVRPFQSDDEKTEAPLDVEYLDGRSMEAALLAALWAANGGIPEDDYRSDKAFRMEPQVAVTGVVTDVQHPEPGSFEIDAVYGIHSKLKEAERQQLYSVVLAARRTVDGVPDEREKYRDEIDQASEYYQKLEQQMAEQQMEQAAVGNTEQLYSLRIIRLTTARQVFDALLVTNRWLAKWQDLARHNWLKRWEARPKSEAGKITGSGARAPGDEDEGPDDVNKPVANVVAGGDKAAESKADDNAGTSDEQFERETR